MAKKFIELKKEILNIEDIQETAKALEKIAAVHVHDLETTTSQMRRYEKAIEDILSDINAQDIPGDFFQEGKNGRLLIVMGPEEGLCGDMPRLLLKFSLNHLKKEDEILVIGQEANEMLSQEDIKAKYFFKLGKEIPDADDARKIMNLVLNEFQLKQLKEVIIFYPSFVTLVVHQPKLFQFLPISRSEFLASFSQESDVLLDNAIYEPSKSEILNYLTKEYLILAFYEKILETKLSELSARTVAMGEADKKAKKLIKNLYHRYFRIKRAEITKAITDLYFHPSKSLFYE